MAQRFCATFNTEIRGKYTGEIELNPPPRWAERNKTPPTIPKFLKVDRGVLFFSDEIQISKRGLIFFRWDPKKSRFTWIYPSKIAFFSWRFAPILPRKSNTVEKYAKTPFKTFKNAKIFRRFAPAGSYFFQPRSKSSIRGLISFRWDPNLQNGIFLWGGGLILSPRYPRC